MIAELPNDVDEYRLLFEGEYNKTTDYWKRNFVTIDNLELRRCDQKGKLLPAIPYHLQDKPTTLLLFRVIRYPKLNKKTTSHILLAHFSPSESAYVEALKRNVGSYTFS